MRIAITGASGFVGSQLIPRLHERGVELVLLGRDPERLRALHTQNIVFGYDDMEEAFCGVDAILHLAVMNNDHNASLQTFRVANVGFLQEVVKVARIVNASLLIYVSTIHVVDKKKPYGLTKAEAEKYLNNLEGDLETIILRLPAVYGDGFAGRLGFIFGVLPHFLRKAVFTMLAAIKPTVHIDEIVNTVIEMLAVVGESERIVTDGQKKNLVYHGVKRFFDLLFATSLLIVFWWLLVLIWIAVRATSPGPGIFAQERVGRYGQQFICYKFRTMKVGTRIASTHTVSTESITPIGYLLRKTKLDELPQLFNILRNEMSLVGPRPCLAVQTELIEARRKRGVLEMKCGITGYAQINDIDMSDPERLAKADAYYLKIRTIPFDMMIVLRTFLGFGQGDRTARAPSPTQE